MSEIEKALLEGQFIRIHKSYIINLNNIHSIDGNIITIKNSLKLPIGANYKGNLMEVINSNAVISKRKDI